MNVRRGQRNVAGKQIWRQAGRKALSTMRVGQKHQRHIKRNTYSIASNRLIASLAGRATLRLQSDETHVADRPDPHAVKVPFSTFDAGLAVQFSIAGRAFIKVVLQGFELDAFFNAERVFEPTGTILVQVSFFYPEV